MKVSVIVPVYNASSYLRDCLDSIASQTLEDIEVICVDDCSRDDSRVICREYAQRDNRFRVFALDQNSGAAVARNLGMTRACGEYVAFMDADDWYPEDDSLELLYRAAVEENADLCAGCIDRFDEAQGKVIAVGPDESHLACFEFDQPGWITYADWQYDYGYTRFLYRRAFLQEHGIEFPLLRRHQDPVFLVRCLVTAGSFYAIPHVVYRIRMGYKRMQFSEKQMDDVIEGISQVLAMSYEYDLPQLRHWQKVLMRQYVVQTEGVLQDFYLKDLIAEVSRRVSSKASNAIWKVVKRDRGKR